MSSMEEKTVVIRSTDGSTAIELTAKDLEEYTQCVQSKRFSSQLISLGVGAVAFVTIPVTTTSTRMMQIARRGLTSIIAMSCASILCELRNVISCGPILKKIIEAKQNNVTDYTTPVEDEENSEASTKELLDFTPSISSHDFNSPINFSSDSSGLGSSIDKREQSPSGKKRVTYDELWKMHKENSQIRNKTKDYITEGGDLGLVLEDEPTTEKRKVRTNKYGDPLE